MIFCEKEKVGSATGRTNVKMGTWTQADIRLITGVLAPEQAAAQTKVVKQLFADGLAASQPGRQSPAGDLEVQRHHHADAQLPELLLQHWRIAVAVEELGRG